MAPLLYPVMKSLQRVTVALREAENCLDLNYCTRDLQNIPRGTQYEKCRSVHAEANAIISASRRDMIGATLYLVGREKPPVPM